MIDTHCHIDDPVYAASLDGFLNTQREAGVESIVVPGVNGDSVQTVMAVCQRYPGYLYPALGLHPEEVKEDWRLVLEKIEAQLSTSPCPLVAIGEIGLDYHFDTTYKRGQQEALRVQLRWAEERHLPVLIHSRDATEDTLTILRDFPQVKGVFHCFSGSAETAQQIVQMGYYIGVGGVITFKNCKLREHIACVPLERIVLETDAPYMAPVPHRGETNESRWMRYVMDELAKSYQLPVETIEQTTTANAKKLFCLK
ncbi:MAG: TatD family hydrolase [Paludibacteraceae bacterium]|nr:TatD family hydrolase [Paludibacteraceae bacterium]